MAKTSRTVWRIAEGVFIGAVMASNLEVVVRGMAADQTVQAPVWFDASILLGAGIASYWWARLLLWLVKQFWRGACTLRPRRPITLARGGTERWGHHIGNEDE